MWLTHTLRFYVAHPIRFPGFMCSPTVPDLCGSPTRLYLRSPTSILWIYVAHPQFLMIYVVASTIILDYVAHPHNSLIYVVSPLMTSI
jgi:hypothetical protein